MEKISGIIPRNIRNSSADLSKSQPVRPGAPSFGRSVGKVTTKSSIDDLSQLAQMEKKSQPELGDIEDKVSISDQFQKMADKKNSTKLEAKSILEEEDSVEEKSSDKSIPGIEKKFSVDVDKIKNSKEDTEDESQTKNYNKKGEAEKSLAIDEITRKFNRWEV